MSTDIKFGLSTQDELQQLITHLKLNLHVVDNKPNLNIPIGHGIIFDIFHFGSETPPIGHWMMIKRLNTDSVIVIDSYGVYHQVLVDELQRIYKNILIVLDQQQNLSSHSCGYYCVLNFYLLERDLYKPKDFVLIQNGMYQLSDDNIKKIRYDEYENIYTQYGL